MKILSTACANALHFFYPAYCLHCDEKLKWPTKLICTECFQQIEWIDRKQRCPNCFGPRRCKSCLPLHPHRSLFEATGPQVSLYTAFLQTKRPTLLASLIVLALSKLSWEMPQVIVPALTKPIVSEDPAFILAKEVAKLQGMSFALPSNQIEGKHVLLLVPSLSSGSHLFKEKKRLAGFFPAKIYTLALIDERD